MQGSLEVDIVVHWQDLADEVSLETIPARKASFHSHNHAKLQQFLARYFSESGLYHQFHLP